MKQSNKLVFICGRICCGKGHIIETKYSDHYHIIVSDTVKELISSTNRVDLQTKTADLDHKIADRLIKEIKGADGDVCIDGIRQLSILKRLTVAFIDRYDIDFVWVNAYGYNRHQRYLKRCDEKDSTQTFEEAEAADVKLGLTDVEVFIKKQKQHTVIYND